MNRPEKAARDRAIESPDRAGLRRPYRTPQLVVHGNVKDLTRVKGGGKSDGGGKPRTRTSGSAQ